MAPVAQTQAGQPAGANGQQGLHGLHAVPQRIVPGVEPGGNPAGGVAHAEDEHRQGPHHHGAAADEPAGGDAAGKEDGCGDDHHLDGSRHMGLQVKNPDHQNQDD